MTSGISKDGTNKGWFVKGHLQSNTGKTHFKKGAKGYWTGKKMPMIARENHHNWKGGKIRTSYGYIVILQPEHPRANKTGYVAESILVMEHHIGRYLTKEELVHHINRIRDDNRIENLELFKDDLAHKKHHAKSIKKINGKFCKHGN